MEDLKGLEELQVGCIKLINRRERRRTDYVAAAVIEVSFSGLLFILIHRK
jgi:hypothetical protein